MKHERYFFRWLALQDALAFAHPEEFRIYYPGY